MRVDYIRHHYEEHVALKPVSSHILWSLASWSSGKESSAAARCGSMEQTHNQNESDHHCSENKQHKETAGASCMTLFNIHLAFFK